MSSVSFPHGYVVAFIEVHDFEGPRVLRVHSSHIVHNENEIQSGGKSSSFPSIVIVRKFFEQVRHGQAGEVQEPNRRD